LSERLREGNLIIIDEFTFTNPKTREFLGAIGGLGLTENKKKPTKTLIVDSLDNANLILSSRNVEKTKVTNSFGLNIYDILYHEKLLISKSAVAELNDLLDPKREGKSDDEAAAPAAEKAPKAKKEAKEVKAEEAKPDEPKAKKAEPKEAKAEAPVAEEAKPVKAKKAETEVKADEAKPEAAKPKKVKAEKAEDAPADKEATDNE
jgi:Ribosomal protein L4/L1 family